MPKISVVMPVYNGERYLKEAIESILNQTYRDFEFIIINDGSTDSSEEIIKTFNDERIVYIKNPTNLGLPKTINIGVKASQGEYIARMDADDISLTNRFEKELNFLSSNTDIDLVGSRVVTINEHGRRLNIVKKPLTHTELKWQSLFSTPFIHPTIMAKADVLKNNLYDESLYSSEDYELWSRLIFERSVKTANIEEPLLFYRVFKKSFTQSLNPSQKINSLNNTIKNIERYAPLSEREKEILKKKSVARMQIYWRAAKAFRKKENVKPNLSLYFLGLIREYVLSIFSSVR